MEANHFNFANIDFSNMAAFSGASEQSLMKPTEGETSTFFSYDEGIDTTTATNPYGLATAGTQLFESDTELFPQSDFDMSQNLNMDDTMGSASWNNQLAPSMNDFIAPTPSQSFASAYQPSNSFGKRPLQLDTQDFPQPKRLEYDTFSPFAQSASVTGSSSWTVPTPSSSIEVGLSDEAADVCALWFSKYAVLPGDRHIDSLSQLTGEPASAIRQWFGQMLKHGISGHDSAYKSQTSLSQLVDENTSFTTAPVANGCDQDTAQTTGSLPVLRGGKKGCTPVEDPTLLARDPNKIYQCTRKCGKRYGRKCDWKRNEEEGYPSKSWICSLCTATGAEKIKPCFRRYHFSQHFKNIHPGINCEDYEESSIVQNDAAFPRRCGFCPHRFVSRQDRIDHIAEHFKKGKCMLDWNDEDDDDSANDNTDDDDDKPDNDGYDDNSGPSDGSPDKDMYGGPGPKRNGRNGGSGGYSPPTGFMQFQLQNFQHASTGVPEFQDQRAEGIHSLQCSRGLHALGAGDGCSIERSSPAYNYTVPVARDGVSMNGSQLQLPATSRVPPPPIPHPGDDGPLLSMIASCVDAEMTRQQHVGIQSEKHLASPKQPKGLLQERSLAHADAPEASSDEANLQLAVIQVSSDPVLTASSGLTNKDSTASEGTNPQLAMRQTQSSEDGTGFLSVRLLGTGGFSTVDEVVHRQTKLRISRKTLKNRDQSAIEELKKEVGVLQKLRHPHIIRFLGAYSQGDRLSLLLSPVAETTLALWLGKAHTNKPDGLTQTIAKMYGCLASSVRYLHEQRPVLKHMDIKPANILIVDSNTDHPHVILCDFGISSSDSITAGGQHKPLTRQYIAPEVPEGLAREQAADIWSLGCVFLEMAIAAFSHNSAQWNRFRDEFCGCEGKCYWQNVPGLHAWLSRFLDQATDQLEATMLSTVKQMLSGEADVRPDAGTLTMIFAPAPCCLSWPNEKASFPGPDEELSSVEMLTPTDGIDCPTQLEACSKEHSHPHDDFKQAKSWLDRCAHDHGDCQHQSKDKSLLPTRLLDLQSDSVGGLSVQLINSADIVPGQDQTNFAAVSYVWNTSDLLLTAELLERTHGRLSTELLPTALRDAINAANNLGQRYVWVDNLCIRQDSDEEKERECNAMASVYRNAAITIVPENKQQVLDTSLSWYNPGTKWDTRAWSLQERLLSHRLLYLTGGQMYWECNSLKASETFPRGLPSLVWEKVHTKPTAHAPVNGSSTSKIEQVSRPWNSAQYLKKREDNMKLNMASTNRQGLHDPELHNDLVVPPALNDPNGPQSTFAVSSTPEKVSTSHPQRRHSPATEALHSKVNTGFGMFDIDTTFSFLFPSRSSELLHFMTEKQDKPANLREGTSKRAASLSGSMTESIQVGRSDGREAFKWSPSDAQARRESRKPVDAALAAKGGSNGSRDFAMA